MSRAFADAIRANDPALHKPGPRISDVSSVSTLSASTASSASFRPSSASSVSSAGSVPPRAKTPAGTRSVSRASDFNARSASRAGRTFEVGDNVRIESLGFEGKLQYLGEIDGKPGIWAGVALSAGFVGKGKNDGSVAGYVSGFTYDLIHKSHMSFHLANNISSAHQSAAFSLPPPSYRHQLLGQGLTHGPHLWPPTTTTVV
jgi:hypothetical protein